MIQTRGITKSYGDLKVLKGIDIEIREREVVSIVGASGAGKTTLLQIIGTLDKPDSGTVTFNRTDISRLKARRSRHSGTAISALSFSFTSCFPNSRRSKMYAFLHILQARAGMRPKQGRLKYLVSLVFRTGLGTSPRN